MNMGMMIEVLPPRMQHRRDSYVGTQMLWVRGNCRKRLGHRFEQEPVDLGLVLVGDGADLCRQGEHHMEVGDRQQFRFARRKPIRCG